MGDRSKYHFSKKEKERERENGWFYKKRKEKKVKIIGNNNNIIDRIIRTEEFDSFPRRRRRIVNSYAIGWLPRHYIHTHFIRRK